MIKEYARISYVDATGTLQVGFQDITGPTVEAAKTLGWFCQTIVKDGGKITDVAFGVKSPFGEFIERRERATPVVAFDGFRRMSSHLRA